MASLSQDTNCNVGTAVDEANDPSVLGAIDARLRAVVSAWSVTGGNAKSNWERQIRAVGAGLIPALNGGGDGVQDDGEVEHPGVAPLVGDLCAKGVAFAVVELGHGLVASRTLRDEGTFAEQRQSVGHAVLCGKVVDVGHELVARDADEWVLDFSRQVVGHGGDALAPLTLVDERFRHVACGRGVLGQRLLVELGLADIYNVSKVRATTMARQEGGACTSLRDPLRGRKGFGDARRQLLVANRGSAKEGSACERDRARKTGGGRSGLESFHSAHTIRLLLDACGEKGGEVGLLLLQRERVFLHSHM